jgi:hypothetical protein
MRIPGFTADAALGQTAQRYATRGLIAAAGAAVQPQRIKLPDSCDALCGGNVACALACRLGRAALLPITYGDLTF